MGLFLSVLVVTGFFAYQAYFSPEAAKRREVDRWVGIIGAAVELPRGERPTVGTVADPLQLRDQAFFAEAERGDRVLIYERARRAVLYRPSTGKVITMTTDVVIEKE